jgi:GxxExxY protein
MNAEIFSCCDRMRETAFSLHSFLRSGHLEKIYGNGLAHRRRARGLSVHQQYPLAVSDQDGTRLGELIVDLLVDRRLIVEVKAGRSLVDEHVAQLLGYLRAARIEHGILINFGAPRLEIRKFVLSVI